jgi:hypothetical protein
MEMACSTHGVEEEYVQCFGGKVVVSFLMKETTRET